MWWRDGVLYQVYPRSFADSDGDGIGDLAGIAGKLDYLAWLGVAGIWLNPTFPSPNRDWGYDVADYRGVHPELGTERDLERLIAEAARRDIRVLLDLVPNHTSDRHPWFLESRSRRDAPRRDWYVWREPGPGGGPPNNWLSVFGGGSAWTLDEGTGQYYLHNFLPSMPDLNWWNEEVREAFDDILRYWFDRGVAGFRIDVAHGIVKDQHLRDNVAATEEDHPLLQRVGQRQEFNFNRPEVHDVLRRWRKVADAYDPPRILVGETWVLDLERWAAFYGSGRDELDLAFNFPFAFAPLEAAAMREVVERAEALIPEGAWPVWMGSNHDIGRFVTRWCGDDPQQARVALLMLLTLRGTPFLYYGDEIGMAGVEVPEHRLLDPAAGLHADEGGRDHCRTPMQWSPEPGAGVTEAGVEPWLPLGDHRNVNVEDQRADPASMLHLCRDLIAARAASEDLRSGAFRTLPAPGGSWAWRRGRGTVVAANLSDRPVTLGGLRGRIKVATDRSLDGRAVGGDLRLEPWQGVVLDEPRC